MPEFLTLSVLHTGHKELTVMRSLLNLAGTDAAWQVSDRPGGDFTIVDVDTEEGATLWDSLGESPMTTVAFTRDRAFSAERVLAKPLRSRQFLDLLQDLQLAGSGQTPVEVPVEVLWESWEPAEDHDSFTLAEHLRRGTWTSPVVVIEHGWPELVIDAGSGTWYYDGAISDMTPAMFARPIAAAAGVPLDNESLCERIRHMRQRSLGELKWFAGLAQSRGRLHPDLFGEFQFMLTQVPPLAIENERLRRLAQLLIRSPITIDELHRESGEAAETVAAFVNACYTCGRLLVNQPARAVSF